MKKYAVSLIYQKEVNSGFTIVNALLIVTASSEEEALGIAIKQQSKNHDDMLLSLSSVLEINQ